MVINMAYDRTNRKICGIGINDADYPVKETKLINGKNKIIKECATYNHWKRMIYRCYSKIFKESRPTYKDCKVCEEWLVFSNFKEWASQFVVSGMHLDKDIICKSNIYSPETCAFVNAKTNSFILDCAKSRGKYPIGVHLDNKVKLYVSACRNPFTRKKEYLGYFKCQEKAHLAWKKRKHELACQLADLQTDERVANALRTRYL